MIKRIIFLAWSATLFQINFNDCNAQDTTNTIGKVSIASPNAASLGKYGDIPVSYNTGIPQISVPIYTVKSGNISLPISLSYHAGGLKVAEQASWVGAGWTLNAGGVITRTVVGAPDDRGYSTTNVYDGHYSDYGYNSYLNGSGGNPDDNLFAKGNKDGEPDLYFFNFGGYIGKFYFNDDRTPMLVPEQDFKIQTSYTLGSGFTGFIVTTPDGVQYYFGKTGNNSSVDPIESTTPSTLANGPSYTTAAASSWFLNKIMSADGMDSITLNYQTESYSYYTLSTSPMLYTNYIPTDANKMGITLVKNFVSGVRLFQINFPNGSITFNKAASARSDLAAGIGVDASMNDATNTSAYALGSISINGVNGFCKKDSLYYGYFFDNTALNSTFFSGYSIYNLHSDEYRLRLDSIQESSCDGTLSVPPYKFSYFSEAPPRRLSFGIDHWGYFNSQSSNPGLVPTYTVITSGTPSTSDGANRDASWPAMRAGTLQRITYLTGGNTTFDFEPKSVDTFFSSVLQNVTLQSWTVHEYGQSNLSQTLSFTAPSNDNYTVYVNNTSTNWSPTFIIQNSGGTTVYNSGLIPTSYTLNATVSLSPDTYTATLSFPSNSSSTLINGADAAVKEWQYVPVTTTQTIGGLRIKTITSNDAITSNHIVTNYTYPSSGNHANGGTLFSTPVYLQVIRSDQMAMVWPYSCSPNGCTSCDNVNAHSYFITAGSIRPMATMQGENVGYQEVDVSQTGNGKSVYKYYGSNLWSNSPPTDVCIRTLTQSSSCDLSIPTYPFAPLPFEFMRGELQYEGYFNQSGQALKETSHYPSYTNDPLITPGHMSVDEPGLYSYTEYQLQTAYKTQDKTVTTTYDPSTVTSLTQTTINYYGSPYHHEPTRRVTTVSNGDSLVSNTKYAFDFRISSCDAIPDSLSYYKTQVSGDTSWMYSNIASCTPQNNLSTNCRGSIYTQFRQKLAQDRVNFINYRRRSYSNPSNTLNNCYATASQNADASLKPILRLQNEYWNAPVEVSSYRNNNLLHANFTTYDTSINPAGFIYPGATQLINLSTPSSIFANAAVSGNSLTKDSRYVDEATYSFNTGNPVQVVPKNGVTSSYIWDYFNTEPIAKVTGATADQIAFTSFEADGKGNWNYTGTPSSDNTSPTGKKSYVLNGSNGLTKSGLNSSAIYIVSYWTKNSTPFSISGTISGYPITGRTTPDGWIYFEHRITGQTSITVSGSGWIDEVRLYPATAQMSTYAYDPLLGILSQCDVNSGISYYEYDALGRLNLTRNQDRNIIKKISYGYNVQFTSNGCSVSPQNVTITSTNTSGSSGFQATYTNVSTSQQYTFTIPSATGLQTLGTVPSGTYNISMFKKGNKVIMGYYSGCGSWVFARSATFSNVSVSTSGCNSIELDSGL